MTIKLLRLDSLCECNSFIEMQFTDYPIPSFKVYKGHDSQHSHRIASTRILEHFHHCEEKPYTPLQCDLCILFQKRNHK